MVQSLIQSIYVSCPTSSIFSEVKSELALIKAESEITQRQSQVLQVDIDGNSQIQDFSKDCVRILHQFRALKGALGCAHNAMQSHSHYPKLIDIHRQLHAQVRILQSVNANLSL
jgi:hypothetical protein